MYLCIWAFKYLSIWVFKYLWNSVFEYLWIKEFKKTFKGFKQKWIYGVKKNVFDSSTDHPVFGRVAFLWSDGPANIPRHLLYISTE